MTTYISSLFHAVLFRFPVRKLKPKTTSLRIYKMWSTMFLPSELTEILGNSSRIQFIKTQQNCSSSMDFESFFGALYIIYQLSEIKDDIQVVSQFPCLLEHPV